MGKWDNIWNKKKDGNNREERSFVRYVIVTSVLFLAIICFFHHDNVFRWVKAGRTARKQEKQIELYREQIQDMEKELDYLTNDRDSLEKFAREKFGFCEPGEDVYIFDTK